MGFSIKGYVLEKPRVGASNSPFTLTPDVIVTDSGAYNAAYPSTETNPRTDFLVLAVSDGKLPDALFGWTKNEGLTSTGPGVNRFDYDGKHQSFRTLPGSTPLIVGVVSGTLNTTRLKVPVPIGATPAAPFRLSVGLTGSGTTLSVSLVTAFGSPPPGTVELLTVGNNAGELNWNSTDLATYDGETIKFQRQAYFTTKESNGKLGPIANNSLLLTPIPGTGQFPLLRIGYSLWLTTVERPDEASFSLDPVSGTVEWALDTGMLKFNSADITANNGRNVYYDGTLFARDLSLPRQSLGTVNASGDTSPQATTFTVPPAGGDIIFRVPGIVQFPTSVLVTSFDATGKQGQVQYNSSGQVQISLADRIAYGGQPLEVVVADLPIERGLSMRFFRTPVDLAGTDPTLKDVTSVYGVTGASWADPIMSIPQVFLPSIPIDDPVYPVTITVAQGTGSFTGTLPRQDVLSPPAGNGYVINFDQAILQYTKRNNNLLVPLPQATAVAVLPDPLVVDSQTSFELETAPLSGIYTPLVENVDYLLDATAGQVNFTTTFGAVLATSSAGLMAGTSFVDTTVNFVTAGVQPGDSLVVLSGAPRGVYTIVAVAANQLTTDLPGTAAANLEYEVRRNKEVLGDRFFEEVAIVDPNTKVERIRTLGTISNSPRLAVPVEQVTVSRFRFGQTTFSTSVTVVANDGAFTAPGSLSAGVVEISQTTGNINFSQADVTAGGSVYWVRRLTQGVDYKITPELGLIEFAERMMQREEALITYASENDPTTVITERATFLVRKETSQPHPLPVSTISFNPDGHQVATNPPPRVFRGGRPQVTGTQVLVDTVTSTIKFLEDSQLTDALPHGQIVNPNERILVDYYIYDAIGGEKTTTVLNPPISLARVNLTEGESSFTVVGDQTAAIPGGTVLRVGSDQVYLVASSVFAANQTTITLDGGQTFLDDIKDPKLAVSSGLIRTTSTITAPSYFATELSAYDPVSRGMNLVKIAGDRTSAYKANTLLLFTTGSLLDLYLVTGAKYNASTNRTEINIATNTVRQYDSQVLKYSVRPIVEAGVVKFPTTLNPILTFPSDPTTQQYRVFRRTEGDVGQILVSPTDYTIDNSGVVTLTTALQPNEEVSIFYTGHRIVQAGLRLKSSYTNVIAPTQLNGLLNQVLKADYSTFNPDNFYFRVETMSNFRGETADDLESQAKQSVPGGGPMTSNTSSPKLPEQGRESVFFEEGHLGNQDLIARSILKFYNDAVNYLEDALHAFDGRVVGDSDGRFKFDGNIDNPVRTNPSQVTNQIDDQLQVSPFPLPNGTSQSIYLAGPFSRFFKTRRDLFASSPAQAGSNDGDVIAALSFKKLSSLPTVCFKRKPRAQIQFDYPAGTTTFIVDNATGTNDALQRPAFINQMRVVIQDANGTFYIDDAAQVTVTGTSAGPPQTITLSAGPTTAVPAGATIYVSPSDANTSLQQGDYPPAAGTNGAYMMQYRFGHDVDFNLDTGEFLYKARSFPYNGVLSILPPLVRPFTPFFDTFPIQTGDILQIYGANLFTTDTAPYKFPALTGGTYNDDGDQAVPIVGPTFDGEITPAGGGPLNVELLAEQAITGTWRTSTTAPYVGTGSLDVTNTIITDASPFAAPLPKVYDLVRILSGANGATEFRRVIAVGANTVTVDSPFSVNDSNFQYTITVSSLAITGTATLSGTTLTDMAGTFTTNGTEVGHTVVMTTGPNAAYRRQVVAIVDANNLTLDAAFPSATGGTYRIDNPLDTYGGVAGSAQSAVSTALATEIATITTNPDSESAAIANFFNTVFTTILTSGAGSTSGSTFTDLTQDFVTALVNASHFIFIQSGPELGVYQVASVDSPTQITVATPFPGVDSSVSYQIVSVFGAGKTTLADMLAILAANSTFSTSTTAFQAIVDTPVTVFLAGVPDTGAFARAVMTSDLDSRVTDVQNRLSYLSDPANGAVAKIQNVLSGTERLYDKRYTWIDARINLEKGLLVKQQRAVADRIKAQEDVLKQLTKLLAVQA